MDKIKIIPKEDQQFKEIEVSTKNWNLKTRREIDRLLRKSQEKKDDSTFFDACCDILFLATTLTEKEVFDLSKEEIEIIADNIYVEINKKK